MQMRLHVGLDELHRVVNRQPGRNRPARAVDVEQDVLVGILGLEEQHLRDDQIGDLVVDRRADEDDAVLQQPRKDVVGALAAVGLFDDHRHELHARDYSNLISHIGAFADWSGKVEQRGQSYESTASIVARAITKSIAFSRRKPAHRRDSPPSFSSSRPHRRRRRPVRSAYRSTSCSTSSSVDRRAARAARSRRAPARSRPPRAPASRWLRGTRSSRCPPVADRCSDPSAAARTLRGGGRARARPARPARRTAPARRAASSARARSFALGRVPRFVLEVLAHARRAARRASRTRRGPSRTRRRAPAGRAGA